MESLTKFSELHRKELATLYSNMKSQNDIDKNIIVDMKTSKLLTEGHFNKL